MADKLISTNELRQRAQELIKAKKMPGLDELLKAIGETREKFAPQITEARTATMPEDTKLEVPKSSKPFEANVQSQQ